MSKYLNHDQVVKNRTHVPICFLGKHVSTSANVFDISNIETHRNVIQDYTERDVMMSKYLNYSIDEILSFNSNEQNLYIYSGNTRFRVYRGVLKDTYSTYAKVCMITVSSEDYAELREKESITREDLVPKLKVVVANNLPAFFQTKLRVALKSIGLNPKTSVIYVDYEKFLDMFFSVDFSYMGMTLYNPEWQKSVAAKTIEAIRTAYPPPVQRVEEVTFVTRVDLDEVSLFYLSDGSIVADESGEVVTEDNVVSIYRDMNSEPDMISEFNDRSVFLNTAEEIENIYNYPPDPDSEEDDDDDDFEPEGTDFDDDDDDVFNFSNVALAEEVVRPPQPSTPTIVPDNLSLAGSIQVTNGFAYHMSDGTLLHIPSDETTPLNEEEVIEAYQEIVAPAVYGTWGWIEQGARFIFNIEEVSTPTNEVSNRPITAEYVRTAAVPPRRPDTSMSAMESLRTASERMDLGAAPRMRSNTDINFDVDFRNFIIYGASTSNVQESETSNIVPGRGLYAQMDDPRHVHHVNMPANTSEVVERLTRMIRGDADVTL